METPCCVWLLVGIFPQTLGPPALQQLLLRLLQLIAGAGHGPGLRRGHPAKQGEGVTWCGGWQVPEVVSSMKNSDSQWASYMVEFTWFTNQKLQQK